MSVKFNIAIKSGDDAFVTDTHSELCTILFNLSGDLLTGKTAAVIFDSNGNKVGNWSLEIDEPEETPNG